ncbi:uncharacterized protein FOMMEDRAFT_31009 [Fomitiporia mediterranea MF3/22]|uniref:uncharacterized protein n=1 Tax=Fomitiporia mediterranea (strain MF3/22) TaxID=694068 RepID=UPI0004407F37|nr:uncharacterized protein FOMMEDRAFT_31009 [Fomitiporia mediterranea MF3/22]EJC99717.1 hypothetical protein FOMMEDRAFT_31009 [Fomitiporia mediterranea MF3/22]
MSSLPSYTKDWPGIVRPVNPKDLVDVPYDTIISTSSIFWQKRPGSAVPRMVVRSRCTNCKHRNLRRTTKRANINQLKHLLNNVKHRPGVCHCQTTAAKRKWAALHLFWNDMCLFDGKGVRIHWLKYQNINLQRQIDLQRLVRKDNVLWTTLDMGARRTRPLADKIPTPRIPYIWAETYEELLGAVPFLSTMNNGVSAEMGFGLGYGRDRTLFSYKRSKSNSTIMPEKHSTTECTVSAAESTDWCQLPPGAGDDDCPSDMELEYPEEESICETSLVREPSPVTRSIEKCFREAGISDLSSEYHDASTGDLSSISCAARIAPNNSSSSSADDSSEPSLRVVQSRPDEIERLYRAYEGGYPVSVIVDTAWSQYPFTVLPSCNIENHSENREPIMGKNGIQRTCGLMQWTFTLRWTPGGPLDSNIPIDIDGRPQSSPPVPWWISSESDLAILEPASPTIELIEPYLLNTSILHWVIMRDTYEGVADPSQRTWLCKICGKLSASSWIGEYVCSYCGPEKLDVMRSRKVVFAHSVLDRQRSLIVWEPCPHVPEGFVSEKSHWKDLLSHFRYTPKRPNHHNETTNSNAICSNTKHGETTEECLEERLKQRTSEGVVGEASRSAEDASQPDDEAFVVDLLFIRNRTELEKDADALFLAFQKEVPMHFERIKSKVSAGIFTFSVNRQSPLHQLSEGRSNWSSAPACITRVRQMMIEYACHFAGCTRDAGESLSYLWVVAWFGESPVKTELQANAVEHPVILMCLGADLNIVFAKLGQKDIQKQASKSKVKIPKVTKDDVDVEMVIEDESIRMANSGAHAGVWCDGEGKERSKGLMAADRLKISLTHGSILVISGADINLTIVRSDMAIFDNVQASLLQPDGDVLIIACIQPGWSEMRGRDGSLILHVYERI